MRLGATVTTRKQNKHWANGKLLILQNQRRPDSFDQMSRSCWLVLMLKELCPRNLFLLNKLWINNFIWRCWKDYVIVYGKNYQKCRAAVFGSFTTTMPCPHGLECAAVFGKKNNMTAILLPPYSPDLEPCDFFLFPCMKGQMEGKRFADVSEVKNRTLEVLNNISTEEFQKCFQQWEKVGTSVSSQEESTLKETRVVIV